jgi:hypothetical protein
MALMRYRPRGAEPDDPRLGRFLPDDWDHLEKYGYSALNVPTVEKVNKTLVLPRWHWEHNQGQEGSCVGHGGSLERAIVNYNQRRLAGRKPYAVRYDPIWGWNEAKRGDEWPETNPGDDNGTSVRAFYDVMRIQGHRRIKTNGIAIGSDGRPLVLDNSEKPDPTEGVSTNRWATTVDEIRTALAAGLPVTIGVNWYRNFYSPVKRGSEYWIGLGDLGAILGGHCVVIYGASDLRQAVRIKNSWGRSYPLVWLPYTVMARLLREYGEAALVVDR